MCLNCSEAMQHLSVFVELVGTDLKTGAKGNQPSLQPRTHQSMSSDTCRRSMIVETAVKI